MRKLARVLCLLLLLMLAACGSEADPTPTTAPVAVATVAPGATEDPAGPAPTLAPPTATALPAPVIDAELTATVAPVVEGSPTPPPLVLNGLEAFGTDRNPLTGELVDDPALLQRRPLAIKISNAPAQWVRPQSGLNDADIVYEHATEGQLTRFTAIFYDTAPPKVGPIRSARLIDVEIPAMYDAALVYSGASVGVSRRLVNSDFSDRIVYSYEDGYYRTGENKPYEHTLYGIPEQFWTSLAAKGENRAPAFTSTMSFSSAPPAGGTPASGVTLDFQWEVVEWRYDPATNRYLRWAAGVPHNDGNTNEHVHASNVVVVIANHVEDATICEQVADGRCVALSVQAQIWNEGPVILLRDGQQLQGTWRRVNRSDMLTFYDSAGNPLPLQIGNSWFEVMPTWYDNAIQVTTP